MKKYSIFTRDNDVQAVKDGWCWPGALIAGFWLPYRGLWKETAIVWGSSFIVAFLVDNSDISFLLSIGMGVWIGSQGLNILAKKWTDRGYAYAGYLYAVSESDAVKLYHPDSVNHDRVQR